jgi:hypothetical protein
MSVDSEDVAPAVASDEATDPAQARQHRLVAGVSALRVRKGSGVPLERMLLIAGSVFIPLGGLLILLGWYGASHTPNLFEQLPYLISGGLLGVALVGAGGFFYFGYWLTKQVYEARSQNERLVAALDRIEDRLALAGASPNGAPAANGRPRGARRAVSVSQPMFVATATGTMLHRPDCAVVANRDGLLEVPADAAGYKPCRLCDPLTVD